MLSGIQGYGQKDKTGLVQDDVGVGNYPEGFLPIACALLAGYDVKVTLTERETK